MHIVHPKVPNGAQQESQTPFNIPRENPAGYFVLIGSNSSHESWAPKFWPGPLNKFSYASSWLQKNFGQSVSLNYCLGYNEGQRHKTVLL